MKDMVALITALCRFFDANNENESPEIKIYQKNFVWYAQVTYPGWEDFYITAYLEDEDELILLDKEGNDYYWHLEENGYSKKEIADIRYAKGSIKYLKATE